MQIMTDDFEELPKMAGWHESNLIVPTSQFKIASANTNHNICFHSQGVEVARFDFNGPELKFTGNPDEGAKVFIDFSAKYFDQRLKDERTKELEACCELLEGMHAATDGNHNYYLHAANELRKLRKGNV